MRDFAFGFLASGVGAGATSLSLQSGQGARFGDPTEKEFEITAYNATDFFSAGDAFQAGEANTYRVTGRTADVLEVVEIDGAVPLNTAGKIYRVELSPTLVNIASAGGSVDARVFGVKTDGTRSDDELATALAKSAANGDELRIPPGTIRTETTILVPSGLRMSGEGNATITCPVTVTAFSFEGTSGGAKFVALAFTQNATASDYNRNDLPPGNGIVRPFFGDGGHGTNDGASNVSFLACEFRDVARQAIALFDSSEGVRVSGCRFLRCGRAGIVANNASGIVIEGSYFEDTGDDAIATTLDSKGVVIANNVIVRGGALQGINDPQGNPYVPGGAAIKFHGQGGTIVGNTMRDSFRAGIRIQTSDSGLGSGPDGVLVSGNVVDGLFVDSETNTEQAAIRLDDATGSVSFVGNFVRSDDGTTNRRCVRFEGSPPAVENGNVDKVATCDLVFASNVFVHSGSSANSEGGINIRRNPRSVVVEGNTFNITGQLLRFEDLGAKMAGVVFSSNKSLVQATTQEPVFFKSGNAGTSVFLATANVFRNNTATAMLRLNDCPIDDFSSFANAKGTIGAEVSGAANATVRNEFLFDDSGMRFGSSVAKISFFGGTPRTKQAITAVTVEQIRDALVQYGLITDNS